MKVTSLIDNVSHSQLGSEHGLSLYIETKDGRKILFDMGQTDMFLKNAESLGIDISKVDIAICSHGHYDHMGGLDAFIHTNTSAPICFHPEALAKRYSLREDGMTMIGPKLTDEDVSELKQRQISAPYVGLDFITFSTPYLPEDSLFPPGNSLLFGQDKIQNDDFAHEQSLIIKEGNLTFLFAGCAHQGITHIIRQASLILGSAPDYVFSGMHLAHLDRCHPQPHNFIRQLADNLMSYTNTHFYTMHCTGLPAYEELKKLMNAQIDYLACGECVNIG